jgi:hypothetical protein
MNLYVNRIGPEEFDRYVIVNESHQVWDGNDFGDVRCGLLYAHPDLAEADAARIKADQESF